MTTKIGMDVTSSKYRGSITIIDNYTNNDTNIFYLQKQLLYFYVWGSNVFILWVSWWDENRAEHRKKRNKMWKECCFYRDVLFDENGCKMRTSERCGGTETKVSIPPCYHQSDNDVSVSIWIINVWINPPTPTNWSFDCMWAVWDFARNFDCCGLLITFILCLFWPKQAAVSSKNNTTNNWESP